MKSLFVLVDPTSNEGLAAIPWASAELASFVVEMAAARRAQVYLATDSHSAIGIGVSLLGSVAARPAEGPDRGSPVIYLPMFDAGEVAEGDRAYGGLNELALAAVLRIEGSRSTTGDPAAAMQAYLSQYKPDCILPITHSKELLSVVSRSIDRDRQRVIAVAGFGAETGAGEGFIQVGPDEALVERTMESTERAGDDREAREHERSSRRQAAAISSLLNALERELG